MQHTLTSLNVEASCKLNVRRRRWLLIWWQTFSSCKLNVRRRRWPLIWWQTFNRAGRIFGIAHSFIRAATFEAIQVADIPLVRCFARTISRKNMMHRCCTPKCSYEKTYEPHWLWVLSRRIWELFVCQLWMMLKPRVYHMVGNCI